MLDILKKLGIIKADTQYEKEKSFRGVLEWDHSSNPGMIYHTSAELPFIKIMLVRPYESAIFLRDGKIYATLPEGRWVVEKMPVLGKMEIVWVDMGWQKLKFGLRTLTRDGIEIGAHGVTFLKVAGPEKFMTNLVTAKNLFSSDDLEDFLLEQINSVLRAEMARYEIQSLYIEREMFAIIARAKLTETYDNLGLEFQTLEVSGFAIPDDVKSALQAPLIAEKQAKAAVSLGTAQAAVLNKIREAGVDPVRLKGAEALMKYAERPSSGSSAPLSGDVLMPLLFYGLLMKDSSISSDIKQQLKNMFPQFSEGTEQSLGIETKTENTGKSGPNSETAYTKEHINNILDQLDERLAKSEITEKTYRQLKDKWTKKLRQIGK
jgi:hypothetical protein